VALDAADDLRFDGGVAAELRRAQSISTGGVTTMSEKRNIALRGALAAAAILAAFVGPWIGYFMDQRNAAQKQVTAQAAQIAALNETVTATLAQRDQARSDLQICMTARKPVVSDAAPSSDSDFVTVIVSQSAPSAAPASADASAAPIVALGNLLRPGLGTMLGNLAPPQTAPSFAPPAFVRWIVLGKVTPYISPGTDVTLTKYAWINLKTQAIEAHDPRPARELVEQLHAQGVR